LPVGYEKIVLKRIQSEVLGKSKKYCYVASHVKKIIETLSENHYLGIISCYPKDYSELLRREYIYDLFKLIVSASDLGFNKLDQRLISYFVKMADITPSNCVMIGDRLDTEIYQANKLGMMTIRVTDSIFSLQSPRNPYEVPCYTVENLKDLVIIINNFVN
jgi:putative hydrolase of the HAD superfamily